ncbi:MlaD family protein [Saccharopolyspora taberi]|uniref:MlaD family protein n=1 Tax=Saccharopolyspora taberi TaxID=60895 RepID=A0ABN3V2X6_9PSEU
MLPKKIKVQIGIFLLVAFVGVVHVGGRYAGLDRLAGPRGHVVVAQLAESGGLSTHAEVTYRGVPVGRVGELRLTADGVEAQLDIDPDAPPVPADTEAVVANRSAVGEQYVDLRPRTAEGPFLADGSVIRSADTSVPLPPEMLVAHLDSLAASVPQDSLRTVVDELDTAFTGAGPQLRTLLDSAHSFTTAATDHLPQTTDLLAAGRTALDTQRSESEHLLTFGRDLRALAATVRESDPALRAAIAAAPDAARLTAEVVRESGPDLGIVLANLLSTSHIVETRLDGLEQALVTMPPAMAAADSVLPGDGRAHFGLVLNVFNPLVCTRGYGSTVQRPGDDLSPAPANQYAYCAEPPGSPTNVRGAQNVP